ncbi:MAG: hypothetical protein QM674_21120 [Burkholderiaceae bacterium]
MTALLPERQFEQPVSGPAYRPFTRLLTAKLIVGLLLYGGWVLWRHDVATPVLVLIGSAFVVVVASGWFIVTGKTTIDRQGIRQDGLFPRRYSWHEISRARFVRWPLSARLMLVTGQGPIKAVHSGNATLDRAFQDIARFYAGVWERR